LGRPGSVDVGARRVVPRREPTPVVGGLQGRAEGRPQLHLVLEDTGEAAHALADALGGRVAEREPHGARAVAVGEERGAGHVGDAGGDGAREHRLGVDARRERQPDVEAAVGHVPAAPGGHQVVQRGDHGVAALAVHLAELLDLALPVVGREVGGDRHLGELGRAQRGGLLRQDELLAHRVRGERPADPEARREGLREGAEVDDALAVVGPQRALRLTVEAEQTVRVVLEDQ
jgi:hypothetical protein